MEPHRPPVFHPFIERPVFVEQRPHPVIEPVIVHAPVVVHEPVIIQQQPVVIQQPVVVVSQPVVIQQPVVMQQSQPAVVTQPGAFQSVTPQQLERVLAKLAADGYKVKPFNPTSGEIEHPGIFGHFSFTYALTPNGLQVDTVSHQEKVFEDVQAALAFARR